MKRSFILGSAAARALAPLPARRRRRSAPAKQSIHVLTGKVKAALVDNDVVKPAR
jgi:hypothetical protein